MNAETPSRESSRELDRVDRQILALLQADGRLTVAELARTVAALGEAGAVELTTLVGYYSLLALQMRVLRVPLPDGAPPATFGA